MQAPCPHAIRHLGTEQNQSKATEQTQWPCLWISLHKAGPDRTILPTPTPTPVPTPLLPSVPVPWLPALVPPQPKAWCWPATWESSLYLYPPASTVASKTALQSMKELEGEKLPLFVDNDSWEWCSQEEWGQHEGILRRWWYHPLPEPLLNWPYSGVLKVLQATFSELLAEQ